MGTVDLDAIRKLAARYVDTPWDGEDGADLACDLAVEVPALIAEVERLTRQRDEARAEVDEQRARAEAAEAAADQLRYERWLLGASRMVLDRVAGCGLVPAPALMEDLRTVAADASQRIVDEIGHPVTDEPALGPSFRAQRDEARAELERVRTVVARVLALAEEWQCEDEGWGVAAKYGRLLAFELRAAGSTGDGTRGDTDEGD